MRSILLLAFAVLLALPAPALAAGRVLQTGEVDKSRNPEALKLEYNVLCIEGYRYVFVFHPRPRGEYPFSGLTQVMEERDGRSLPARCQ